MDKRIVIGSDHGGYTLKKKIKSFLAEKGYKVIDSGTDSAESCDYPLFGFNAAREVSRKKADRGIVICKSGIGMSMVANKLPGVRAGLCLSKEDAVSSRQHNDANILVLASNKTKGKKALELVDIWLSTAFLKGRHARRVRQITAMEKKVFRKTIR